MMRCCRARSHQGDAARRPYMHRRIDPHPALRAGLSLPGRGVSLLLRWEQPAAFCPLTPPTCTLPAGDVGATRWVALRVRRTYGRRVGSHAPRVHDGTRATHRVAPTCRSYSRVRWTNEHRSTPSAPVVGAVSQTAPYNARRCCGGTRVKSAGSAGVSPAPIAHPHARNAAAPLKIVRR
jgi:hypothetical protein